MFLKNKNIIFKIRRSKVTDYEALKQETFYLLVFKFFEQLKFRAKLSLA